MRKILAALAALWLTAIPASAADNYNATAGSGLTFRAKDTGAGLLLPYFAPSDGSAVSIVYGQGSTTSGQSGFLFLCRTLTAAPTDTTAQSNAPRCTTAGELAVSITSGLNTNGQATMANSAPVVIASNQSAVAVKGAGTAGTADANVVTVQGIASMTKLLVTPDSVALPANQSVNVSQINGVTPLMGNGVTGTGSQRVTVASDNTAFQVKVLGNAGGAFDAATGAAPPANIVYQGANASGATGGQVRGLINCDNHVFKHITSATDTLAVQGVASQQIYICGATGNAAGTATWFLEDTQSTNANCSSTLTQITGVATEAANTRSGFYNPIWGGLKLGAAGRGLCINSTGTGGVDVDIWYTQF